MPILITIFQLILKYWKPIALTVITATVTGYISHVINNADKASWQAQENKALAAQSVTLQQQCQAQKAVTAGVANDYETKFAALSDKLSNLKRLRVDQSAPACVPVARPACGSNAAKAGQSPGPDGINPDALYDYAATAEAIGLRLDACQDFIRRTWKLNSGR